MRADLGNFKKYIDDKIESMFEQIQQSPWIPVSERLPEVGSDIIATDRESIEVGFVLSVSPFIDFSFKPTHWMYAKDFQFPLPE